MREACILAFLGFNAWLDFKKKEVSLAAIFLFALAGVAWTVKDGAVCWQYFVPVGLGLFFVGLSVLSRGALGMGDALLVTSLGTMAGLEELISALFLGMVSCAVCAGIMLVVLRKNRKTELPFVPFLFVGYVGGMLLWYGN